MKKDELIQKYREELKNIRKEVGAIRRNRDKIGTESRKLADDIQHEKAIETYYINRFINELKQLEG